MNSKITLVILSTISLNIHAASINKKSNFFCGSTAPEVAKNLDDIVPTLYGIVSGNAGKKRDWDLLTQLHAPNATITPIFHENSKPAIQSLNVEEFIALNKKFFNDVNFYESEVSNQTTIVGHMATIISEYESRDDLSAEPYATGVNSFQLVNDGRRWCVLSVTWDGSKGGHVIK